MVDEWGTWWDEEPATVRGHLYQQNTLRDAFVAALSLMVFHQHADRVKMANLAQNQIYYSIGAKLLARKFQGLQKAITSK